VVALKPPQFNHLVLVHCCCHCCFVTTIQAVLGPIVSSRGLTHLVPAKLLDPSADPRTAVKAVLKAWLPLSEAVLGMAVTHLPSPDAAAPIRLPHLLSGGSNTVAAAGAVWAAGGDNNPNSSNTPGQAPTSNGAVITSSSSSSGSGSVGGGAGAAAAEAEALEVAQQLERSYSHLCASSSSAEAPLVVFVSKMVAVPANLLPRRAGEAGELVRQLIMHALCPVLMRTYMQHHPQYILCVPPLHVDPFLAMQRPSIPGAADAVQAVFSIYNACGPQNCCLSRESHRY
jgi:hypothetical protein